MGHFPTNAKLNLEDVERSTNINKSTLSQIETGMRDLRMSELTKLTTAYRSHLTPAGLEQIWRVIRGASLANASCKSLEDGRARGEELCRAGKYDEALAILEAAQEFTTDRNDKASLRFGQLAADVEFFTSGYASQFISAAFGTPPGFSANLPSGGPAYPFATPGVRLKLDPDKNTSLLAAIFNGDPAGPANGPGEPESRNRHGLNFRVQAKLATPRSADINSRAVLPWARR